MGGVVCCRVGRKDCHQVGWFPQVQAVRCSVGEGFGAGAWKCPPLSWPLLAHLPLFPVHFILSSLVFTGTSACRWADSADTWWAVCYTIAVVSGRCYTSLIRPKRVYFLVYLCIRHSSRAQLLSEAAFRHVLAQCSSRPLCCEAGSPLQPPGSPPPSSGSCRKGTTGSSSLQQKF